MDTESMTALQELLDERQQYEGWLKALEQRQSTTAPHVYNRVHTDYTLRLDRVLHRLSERTGQLNESLQGLNARLAALRSQESDRTDARQEAELRALVGEYSDEDWSQFRDEADRELTKLAEDRSGVESELKELERIIGMVRPGQAVAEPPAVKEPQPPQASSQQAARTPTPVSVPVRQPSMTPSAETPSIDNFVADWSLRREGTGRPPQPQPAVETPPRASVAEISPFPEPKREQEKTLKCPECGAMNYATEWYCERCGGELATF